MQGSLDDVELPYWVDNPARNWKERILKALVMGYIGMQLAAFAVLVFAGVVSLFGWYPFGSKLFGPQPEQYGPPLPGIDLRRD